MELQLKNALIKEIKVGIIPDLNFDSKSPTKMLTAKTFAVVCMTVQCRILCQNNKASLNVLTLIPIAPKGAFFFAYLAAGKHKHHDEGLCHNAGKQGEIIMANDLHQDIIQRLENGTLEELNTKETFFFQCTDECMGNCCQNIDILLDPWDVETMARHLKISGQDFVKTYCILDMNSGMGWPSVQLKHVAQGACAFMLDDGRCSIYPARSRNCRTAPIARAVRFQTNNGKQESVEKIFMINPTNSCQGHKSSKKWTVQGWLEDSNAYEYYELSDIHLELINYAVHTLHSKQWLSEPVMKMMIPFLYAPDMLRVKLSITLEDVGHKEFYKRRMRALRLILTEMAANLGFGPEVGQQNKKGSQSLMEMARETLVQE